MYLRAASFHGNYTERKHENTTQIHNIYHYRFGNPERTIWRNRAMNEILMAKLALEHLVKYGCTVERIEQQLNDSLIEDCLVHLKELIDIY